LINDNIAEAPVNLGTTVNFAVLAGTTITNADTYTNNRCSRNW